MRYNPSNVNHPSLDRVSNLKRGTVIRIKMSVKKIKEIHAAFKSQLNKGQYV